MTNRFNVFFYLGFITLGCYSILAKGNWSELASHWGIAFLFDPFKVNQPWGQRPLWQRVVLLVQVLVVLMAALLAAFPDFYSGWLAGFGNQ